MSHKIPHPALVELENWPFDDEQLRQMCQATLLLTGRQEEVLVADLMAMRVEMEVLAKTVTQLR
ncbi:MAG: hypothetical protein HY245_07365 [Rhizobiales bacterium]|nr:hypothetical protein [Hyphomicrobiales bacterium]MBI3673223.1 hypothetical protein [Hyphomicrobiales bacterium]